MFLARLFGVVLASTIVLISQPVFARSQPAVTSVPAGVQCRDLPSLFRVFMRQHYSVKQIDETLMQHTSKRFIEIIDPSKNMLLAPDLEQLQHDLPKTFTEAQHGNCQRITDVWKLIMQRSVDDQKIVTKTLTPNFKIDDSTQLILEPEKRQYAQNINEREKLVRNTIHFQMSNYLAAGLSMQEAKRQLIHRYELIGKRLAERQSKGEITGLWAEAFAQALDPHSAYMSPDQLTDFEIALKLSLEGIGAVLTSNDGFTIIQSLVPGGQAEKSGQLRPKDKIIAVAQENETPVPTIDMDLSDVVKMIRGKKGTRVTLTILRESKTTKTLNVTIVRDKIDVSSQAAKITYETRKVENHELKIGIIELPSFYGGQKGGRSSYEDMKNLLEQAHEHKADGIVLDLSRNGGGLLEDAVRISGLFIKRGAIVGTKNADGQFEVLEDTNPEVEWDGPLAIIVSRASASASEIVAGALHDYQRALIIGSDTTFGKGTVQMIVPMPVSIGALRVTTGMFFLPGGNSTQMTGVPSDIIIPSVFDGFNMGEDKLEYALAAQKVQPFFSKEANSSTEKNNWQFNYSNALSLLIEKSKTRIAHNPDFAKIQQQIEDLAKNQGVVLLGDLRKRAAKEKDKTPANTRDVGDKKHKKKLKHKNKKLKDQRHDNEKNNSPEDDEQIESLQKAVVAEGVNILADAIIASLR
ncbi:MAG: carboxy terminal-processing peptidase [Deltaproteobacteria bacterium]|nr:carboxy terminal-processing peptidase [Deltaproteobacteria bacterium]